MVRYEEDKLVIEVRVGNIDTPKAMRNEFLKTILFVIGHMDDDMLQAVSRSELYNLTLIAEALVAEDGDASIVAGNDL